MRHPWANTALLLLIFGQLITGFFGFINGEAQNRWLLLLHGIGAYAIAVVLLWKSLIILDVYGRGKAFDWRRLSFAVLLLMLLATLLSGLIWVFDGPYYVAGFSLITLHIFLAVPLLLLMAWHTWHFRWIVSVPKALNRRAFLRLTGVGAAGLLTWLAGERAMRLLALPGADRRFTGSYPTGTSAGDFPVVSWIADFPEPVNVSTWQLDVVGAVRQPLSLSYGDLLAFEQNHLEVVLDCTGGWYTEQRWSGIQLTKLMALAQPVVGAQSLTIEAVSGYKRRFSLAQAGSYLLAMSVSDQPLSHGHGFPLRLVAPGQRGVNWVKWISRIQVNESSKLWQLPVPLQ